MSPGKQVMESASTQGSQNISSMKTKLMRVDTLIRNFPALDSQNNQSTVNINNTRLPKEIPSHLTKSDDTTRVIFQTSR